MRIDEVTWESTYNEKRTKDPLLVFFGELCNSSLIINVIAVLSPDILIMSESVTVT